MQVICLAKRRFNRGVLTSATNFYSRRLGFRSKNVSIIIHAVPGLIKQQGASANLKELERGLMLITLDSSVNLTTQVQYLAHELVHVKQMLSGKLVLKRAKRTNKLHYIWNGRDLTHLPYAKRPWEREAMIKEVVLTYELFEAMGINLA